MIHPVPTAINDIGKQTTSLFVERILTKNVAVLTMEDRSLPVIGKHFGLHPDAPIWHGTELAAYAACKSLPLPEKPYLYSVCRVVQSSPFTNIILLTEFIEPGTTVAELVYEAYSIYDTDDDDEIACLDKLQESPMQAMNALHNRYFVHNDLAGRNLVVLIEGESERQVVVDFDCSLILSDDLGRFKSRIAQDREKLGSTMQPKGSERA